MDASRRSVLQLLIFITLSACILLILAFQGNPEWESLVGLCLPGSESDASEFQDCVLFFYHPADGSEEQQTSDESPTPTSTPSPTPTRNPDAPTPTATPSPTPSPTPTPNPDGIPVIINSKCLNNQQLMIVFEFPNPVSGLYGLIVDDMPYQIAPVPDYPARLYFFGAAPPGGGMPTIVMRSLPGQTVVLEVTDYSVPQCDFQSPNQPGGGGDDYVPPPIDPPPGG